MTTHETVARTTSANACAACGSTLEPLEEYSLDIAGREIVFYASRCPSCHNEYVNAPEILRPDAELFDAFRPNASPLGTFRRVLSLTSRDREFRLHAGDKVAGTLLWYLLEEDLADVVFLAQQSVTEEPVMAFQKRDLFDAAQIRMGPGRAVVTGGGLRANLLTLTQLRNFVEADGGLHPRIAVMGRPCQTYTIRKLLWDRFAPGYELAFALGTFCYGNFAPVGWGGKKLWELLGFDPGEIRQVRFHDEELEFSSVRGAQKKVPQSEVAGLVNANCLQCYDFTVSFSDVSVGHVGREEFFEAAIVRSELGDTVLDQAVSAGFLAPSAQLYGRADVVEDEKRAVAFLNAMVDVKKKLTHRVR